jgi:hypothetical protein
MLSEVSADYRAGFGFGDIAKAAKGVPWADVVHTAATVAPAIPIYGTLASPLLNAADKSLQPAGIAWNLILDDGLVNLWMSYQTSGRSVPTFPLPPDWTADKAKGNAAGVQAELTKRNLLDKANDKVKVFLAPPPPPPPPPVPLQPPAVPDAAAPAPVPATPAAPTPAMPAVATATPVVADPPKTAVAAGCIRGRCGATMAQAVAPAAPGITVQQLVEQAKFESYPDALMVRLDIAKGYGPINTLATCIQGVLFADIQPYLDELCEELKLPAGTPVQKVAHAMLVHAMTKDLAALSAMSKPTLRPVAEKDLAGWANVLTEKPKTEE